MRCRFRLRTRIRRHLPWALIRLNVAAKGRTDCGCHEWYLAHDDAARCYHCEVGSAAWSDVRRDRD